MDDQLSEDIYGSTYYAMKPLLQLYSGNDVIYDAFDFKDVTKNVGLEVLKAITDCLTVEGFSAPTFFVSKQVLDTLSLEACELTGPTPSSGLISINSASFKGQISVFRKFNDGDTVIEFTAKSSNRIIQENAEVLTHT